MSGADESTETRGRIHFAVGQYIDSTWSYTQVAEAFSDSLVEVPRPGKHERICRACTRRNG